MRKMIAVIVLLLIAGAALAYDDEIGALEGDFIQLAKETSAKTVGITTFIEKMGRFGMGSGAIISPDGYILTCSHVASPKDMVVVLADGRRFRAKLVARCARNDYALLKIEAQNLPCFELGDSSVLKVGDWVAALGHPGGLRDDSDPTFAVGKVTGLNRKLLAAAQIYYPDSIRTDIPISPGNSGGPLVGMDRKLIGINGAAMPMVTNSYSCPIDRIKANLAQLKEGKNVKGEGPKNIMEAMREMQQELGPEAMEKMMERLGRGGGKLPGQFKGFGDSEQLKELLRKQLGEGDLQKQLQKALEGLLGRKPGSGDGEGPGGALPPTFGRKPRLGVRVEPVSDELKEQLKIDGGVTVTEVLENYPAEKAGLKEHDVIIEVNGKKVNDLDEVRQALDEVPQDQDVKLTVLQAGTRKELTVKPAGSSDEQKK